MIDFDTFKTYFDNFNIKAPTQSKLDIWVRWYKTDLQNCHVVEVNDAKYNIATLSAFYNMLKREQIIE